MSRRTAVGDSAHTVVVITALAILARFVTLGTRIAHWDEGRVAYWVLRYAETGEWSYRPIIHGPFVQHAARASFELLGTSDFTARVPVAIVGGLLPLAALLFRNRLRKTEVTALALVLAFNPLLLYFSRFFRSDVPLAAFMFVVLGCAFRAAASRRHRYVYAGALALACAFAAKENAILYLLSWAGATGMVTFTTVLTNEHSPRDYLDGVLSQIREIVHPFGYSLLGASSLFLLLIVFFYAPRAGTEGVGLWTAVSRPSVAPTVITDATIGSAQKLVAVWVTGGLHGHPYLPFLGHYLAVLAMGALSTVAFAAYGIWHTWRANDDRATLLQFCGWWGLASVVGYPYAADIQAPWLAVHAVIAFAIPAAVGIAALYRRGRDAWKSQETVTARRIALVFLLACAQVGGVAMLTSYTSPTHDANFIAQGAQPGGDLRPTLHDVERIAREHEGADVLYYGEFATVNESVNAEPPAGPGWYRRLPFGWYTATYGANETNAATLDAIGPNPPPVVIAPASARAELAPRLEGYDAREHAHTRFGGVRTYTILGRTVTYEGNSVVFFIDRSALES